MATALDNLCGPGKPMHREAPDDLIKAAQAVADAL